MIIGNDQPTAQPAAANPASPQPLSAHQSPGAGSRQCPYCVTDSGMMAAASLGADELGLLRHLVGLWERQS